MGKRFLELFFLHSLIEIDDTIYFVFSSTEKGSTPFFYVAISEFGNDQIQEVKAVENDFYYGRKEMNEGHTFKNTKEICSFTAQSDAHQVVLLNVDVCTFLLLIG